jgi:hypothetical protein
MKQTNITPAKLCLVMCKGDGIGPSFQTKTYLKFLIKMIKKFKKLKILKASFKTKSNDQNTC